MEERQPEEEATLMFTLMAQASAFVLFAGLGVVALGALLLMVAII